jgi:TPR repeat protein
VPKSVSKALELYRLSAEAGFAGAQLELGVMYENGEGVERDYAEAAKLYKLSATQGSDYAAYYLARLLADGKGVTKDENNAIAWYKEAARLGNKEAEEQLSWLSVIKELERLHPELDPNHPRYNQQLVDNTLSQQKIYLQLGYSRVDALKLAVSAMEKHSARPSSIPSINKMNDVDRASCAKLLAGRPEIWQCYQ